MGANIEAKVSNVWSYYPSREKMSSGPPILERVIKEEVKPFLMVQDVWADNWQAPAI